MSRLPTANVLERKRTLALLLLVICFSFPCYTIAAEQVLTAETNRWQWVEGRQNQVSKNVAALASSLDAWLAGDIAEGRANESYLNIHLQQHIGSFDGFHSKLKVGGSLDLPRASERWKLIFESDPEELNSLEDSVLGNTNSSESVGGIRYQQRIGDALELSHDVGLRAQSPMDPFYRIRAKHEREIGSNWTLGLSQKVWYYRNDGWGYDTDISFRRQFGSNDFLSVSTEIKYQQSDRETEFNQSVSLHRDLANLESISYSVGVLGISEPNIRVNDYYAEARYRRAIKDDWLFVEVVPQILVSRDESWRPQPRLFINLEVLFFDF